MRGCSPVFPALMERKRYVYKKRACVGFRHRRASSLVGGYKEGQERRLRRRFATSFFPSRLRGTANNGKPLHLRAVTLARIKRVWEGQGGV